ncbi:MAG: ABC transporter ATP-binding protein [Ilumatobacteraceae bacterium]
MTTNTSPAEPVLLRAGELSKQYVVPRGEPVHALEPMSFDIRDREFIALGGPSGCGKSTLLNMIGGLVDRTSGELTIRGEEIRAPRREIGMMFQAPVLFPWRTILSNVLLPVDVRRANRSEHRARAEALLDLVGLSDFGSSYPSQLSGGMQQRASLARLLVQNPDVMLLDEPFGALDEFTREDMNLMLLDIWSSMSKTAILVTHNIPEAVFLADRVFVMSPRPGRLVDVIDVDLPRPRTLAMTREQAFQDLVFAARRALGAV